MQRLLITGGMGFIGNHLAHRLLEAGHSVIIVDKSIYKPVFHDISRAEVIEGDVLSRELMRECLDRVDCCVHLAALASVSLCERDWIFSHENNVLAFNGLIEEIYQQKRPIKFIYASSAAVYGRGKSQPLRETEHVVPCSTYGADKLSNEIYAKVFEYTHQLPSIGLRFFNVYGPGQLANNPYSGVITLFKKALRAGQPLTIHGDGLQSRDFIAVDDVVTAIQAAMQAPQELSDIFNICTGKAISILDLARTMIDLTGGPEMILHDAERLGDIKHAVGAPESAAAVLQFKAQTSMRDGLRKYLDQTVLPLADIHLGGLSQDPARFQLLAEFTIKANQPARAQG